MGLLENLKRRLTGTPDPSSFSGVEIDVYDTRDFQSGVDLDRVNDPSNKEVSEDGNTRRKAKFPDWYINHPYGRPRPDPDLIYRKLAQMGIVQRCLNLVLDEVLDSPYNIVPKDPLDKSDKTKSRMEYVKDRLLTINSNERSYMQEWRKQLTDYFEVGDGVAVKSFDISAYKNINGHNVMLPDTPAGNPDYFQYQAYDSTQFQVFATPHGEVLGHWQFNFIETPPRFFTPRETVIIQDQATTYRHYGRSRISQIKEFLEMVGAQMLQMRNYYQKGGIFQGFVKTTGFSKDDRKKVKAFFDTKFKSMAHKIGLLQAENDQAQVDFIPLMLSVEDLAWLNGLEFVQRFVASIFGVLPSELGLGGDGEGSKAGRAEQGRIFRRRTVRTLKHMIEYRTNTEVIPELDPEGLVEFRFDETPEPEIQRIAQEVVASQIDRGQITVNEWRQTQGLEPVEWGDEWEKVREEEQKNERAEAMAQKFEKSSRQPDDRQEMEGREGSASEPAVKSEEDTVPDGDEKEMKTISQLLPSLKQYIADELEEIKSSIKVLTNSDVDPFTPLDKPRTNGDMGVDRSCIITQYARIKKNNPSIDDGLAIQKAMELCIIAKVPAPTGGKALNLDSLDLDQKIQDCISAKYDIIKSENPDIEHDEILAKALSHCEEIGTKNPGKVGSKQVSDKEKDRRLAETFEPLEDRLRSKLVEVFERWQAKTENLVLEALDVGDVRQVIDRLIDEVDLADEISETMFEAFRTGLNMDDDIEISDNPSFSLTDSRAMEYFREYPLILSESISERVENNLRHALIDSLSKGESIPKTRQRIQDVFVNLKDWEADRVARTEITNASTWGRINQMRGNNRDKWKFYTALDERVCPQCGPLHDEVFSIRELENKPPIHPNCRCTVLTTVGEDDSKSPGAGWFPTAEMGRIEFKAKRPIEAILHEYYNLDNMSYRQISDELGISHTAVGNWVKLMGIKN